MCGFVGFSDWRVPEEKQEIIQRMMQRIVHRGPDMGSSYADAAIALGFRRLSIIDLSENAAQPMYNEDRTIVTVFNGEIYNYQHLRQQLQAKGHVFTSNTDTEVLVHGYEEYGEGIVNKLRGMFAFAVWNTRTGTLFAARDIFGIKPFYYNTLPGGGLLFGSEIKALLEHPDFVKQLNPNALRAYLTFQYAPPESTFFEGVYCLPQGHYMLWDGTNMRIERYWDMNFQPEEGPSQEEWSNRIDEAVHESVEAHRISDVKVGSFLSGGVDSSYITACLMPEKTFSVGFEDYGDTAQSGEDRKHNKFNETIYAAELSKKLGIQNHTKLLTAQECFEAFPEIQYHMDQPQSNPSSVPLWFLAKLAREHVTVVLSGEGADELFAGYELYADTPTTDSFKRKVPRGLRRALGSMANALPAFKGRNFLLKSAEKPANWFVGQASVFPEKEALEILKPAYRKGPSPFAYTRPLFARVQNLEEAAQKQYVDLHLWMPGDILLKADKMCMAHSLELRVPFLDKKIAEIARKIPQKYLIQGTQSKVAFRNAANKTLPDEWANRPKKGFPVPIRHWLHQKTYRDMVAEYFTADWAAEFFDTTAIMQLLDDHFAGRANNARKIWTVYTFLVWYKVFFVDGFLDEYIDELPAT